MKKSLFSTILMLGLVMLAAASATAQSRSPIKVQIPFDFYAGEARLAAGDYRVRFISENVLMLRSAGGKSIIVSAPLTREGRNNAPRLVFHKYGDQYFLAQVWTLKAGSGRALHSSGAERKLIRELKAAGDTSKQTEVTVIAGGN